MAKFNPGADLDKYSNNSKYFSLKDDGDKKDVRILYNTVDDMDGYTVHSVKINGFDTDVSCLRSYADPLEVCPLCEAKKKAFVRFYVPIYDEATGEAIIWKRGQNFYSQLAEHAIRCNPLMSYVTTITRHGKAGDVKTTYALSCTSEDDGTSLEDLGVDIPDPVETGALVEKTFEELTTYVQTGSFEGTEDNNTNVDNNIERRRRDISAGANAVRRRNINSDTPL